ncbi:MAG: CHAT domain-containing protein, partial [Desulfobulbus sp.]
LYRCATDSWDLTEVETMPASGEPCLLFLHGTASSSEGSFSGLWEQGPSRLALKKAYGNRIYAFEHRTLTDSPVANVLDLIKKLPPGIRLHLVSHSRGGLVGELLARANRLEQDPFTQSEIDRFGEIAKHCGHKGVEADVERLRELNREMLERSIRVERFVRVACPARGTTLASGKLDRWASVMANLFGKGLEVAGKAIPLLEPVTKGLDLLQNFLLAVVHERTDGRVLPGLEAMMPDAPLVVMLNSGDVRIEAPLHVLAGDFQGDGLLPWLGDCLSEIFYGGLTDLVVNTPSMSGGAARSQGIWQKSLSGPEVHHLSYFRRDESVQALLDGLQGKNDQFVQLDGPSQAVISRGGIQVKPLDNAPIALMLPGIMGSHLQVGRNRIWFDPIDLCVGRMEDLRVDAANISPDGWMDRNYEKLARYLAQTHEIRPFAYDWRQSIEQAARSFWETRLKDAIKDAGKRGKPLRIVAHSMGGLVARLALAGHWDEFKNIPGSRLLQLGTPNKGSHSIATVLLGRDDFVQSIERWFDWKHDMHDFLAIVAQFPGVLEMLPWPEENGLAPDGIDYFDPATWAVFYEHDHPEGTKPRWVRPDNEALAAARKSVTTLGKAPLAPECCLYVAGQAATPVAVHWPQGKVEIGWIEEGDGRVPWATGIPAGVPVWYTDVAHGDLASHEKAFAAYRELLETGSTRLLPRSPTVARGEAAPIFRERGLSGGGLYPTAEEVLAAATGGARPSHRVRAGGEAPVEIEVIHGSVAAADAPVLVGAYTGDALRGSAKFLNDHLQGRLERARAIGRYPCRMGSAMVFRQTGANTKPAGAIVVGLGGLGELLPGTLTQALTQGLLEYARIMEQQSHAEPDRPERLAVASLLVGGGFAGLAIDSSARCLLEALRRANRLLGQAAMKTRIGHLTLFEEVESRAITLVQALRDLVGETRFAEVARFDGRLRDGQGGYCGRSLVASGGQGMYRVHIVADEGRLRFTVVTDRARNEVSAEPDQRQAVDGLIRTATHTTMDQPGLSRALFELLVPNSMKEAVADLRTLMLSVDVEAASYPWELMRDTDQIGEQPLAARIELVRQLATQHGRGRVQVVTENRAFIVGDTLSGMADLPGAQAEAKMVENFFNQAEYRVELWLKASAQEVFDGLFNGHYRFVHLAGHGVVKDKKTGCTGMVLGPETFLTAAQVTKLRRVPEFVFINCCHLGSMLGERQQWGELAANLATEFIQMGCKAVIAAGWAVDDLAASTFARTFYEAMFKGVRFGQALRQARSETHRNHPQTNTWGAFQAYGDEQYRFPNAHDDDEQQEREYVHPSHLIADLDRLCARLLDATAEERTNYYSKQLKSIEKAARGTDFQHAGVREKLAVAWAEMGERERAIGHYRAALSFEDAGLSLHALEQLANLEIRHGSELLQYTGKKAATTKEKHDQGLQLMQAGHQRLQQLLNIGETTERWSLLGSYWKRLAQAEIARGNSADILTWLAGMDKAYWNAAEHGYKRTGGWDYYPLLNCLDAVFLRALWGEREHGDQLAPQLADLLRGAGENGRQRYAEHRLYFHALAEVEALRIDSLWAFLDESRPQARLSTPEVANHLIGLYRDILGRLGSIREQDSTINQFHFLIKLLPGEGEHVADIKRGLEGLIEGITRK